MDSKKIKILAIDDNKDNLITLKALIEEAFPKALISTALSGAKGLELAASEEPDVILLDIVMPGMDGFEVCKKLKTGKKLADIPVVFVTALKGDKENRIHALECGAEAFLSKPIDESELTAQIQAMVKIRTANIYKHNETERLKALVQERTSQLNKELDERNRILDTLRESEQLFKHVFESSNVGKSITLPTGEINVNKAFCDLLGYSKNELVNKKWQDLTPPEEIPAMLKIITDILEGKNNEARFNKSFIHKNGTKIWTDVSASLVRAENGKPLHFITTIIDISERRLAEEKIVKSEEKFRAVAELSPMAIYSSIGSDQKATYINVAFYKMFGFSMEDVPTVGDWWIKAFPDEKYRQQVMDKWLYNIEQADNNNTDVEALECVCTCKDGSEKNIAWVGKTIGDEFWAFGYDFTELMQAENALRLSEEKFKESFRLSPYLVSLTTMDGLVIEVNDMIFDTFGYTREEFLGNNTTVLPIWVNPEERSASIKQLKQDGILKEMDVKYRKKSCEIGDYLLSATIIEVNKEKILLSIIQDITKRKLAEEEIQKQLEELQRWHKVTIGREGRVIELKREVNELLKKIGETVKYESTISDDPDVEING